MPRLNRKLLSFSIHKYKKSPRNLVNVFRTSIEVLNGDMNKLDGQIRKISSQMKNTSTDPDVVSQMEEFLPVSFLFSFLS